MYLVHFYFPIYTHKTIDGYLIFLDFYYISTKVFLYQHSPNFKGMMLGWSSFKVVQRIPFDAKNFKNLLAKNY